MRLLAKGLVQGVGFRWFVRNSARAAGATGWVRNLSDGSVEIELQGSEDALEQLRREITRGNSWCRVDELIELQERGGADDDRGKVCF